MNVLSAVKLFYLFYSVYTLFVVSVSDYKWSHAIFGVIAIWLAFFAYALGYNSIRRNRPVTNNNLASAPTSIYNNVGGWKIRTYFIHMILCWACSILSARYYTGLGPIQVINHLLAGNSLYALYQRYFRNMGIAAFSLVKIPFILMLSYLTIMLFVSFLGILASGKKIRMKHFIFIASVALSYYYFGMSRGTNFEMYIIFVLLAYCLLCRRSAHVQNSKTKKGKYSSVILVGIFGMIAVGIFRIVLTIRGSVFENNICTEIKFDPNSIFANMFPALTNIGLSVFSYLGYGIYTIGVTIQDIIFTSFENVFSLLFPFVYNIFQGEALGDTLKQTIDIGVHWVPDWVNFTGLFGFPMFLVVMYMLGRFTSKCYLVNIPNLLLHLVCSLSFLFMLSLPVGNFIFTSTPNVALVVFVICWYIVYRHIRISIKNTR